MQAEITLRQAAQQALEALDAYSWEQVNAARAALRTALAEPEQEPMAYVSGSYAGHFTVVPTNPALVLTTGMALYTHPPQRKPLTDEEIDALPLPPSGTATVRDIVRLIERAHGIGGEA
jgi:hypothetical protein